MDLDDRNLLIDQAERHRLRVLNETLDRYLENEAEPEINIPRATNTAPIIYDDMTEEQLATQTKVNLGPEQVPVSFVPEPVEPVETIEMYYFPHDDPYRKLHLYNHIPEVWFKKYEELNLHQRQPMETIPIWRLREHVDRPNQAVNFARLNRDENNEMTYDTPPFYNPPRVKPDKYFYYCTSFYNRFAEKWEIRTRRSKEKRQRPNPAPRFCRSRSGDEQTRPNGSQQNQSTRSRSRHRVRRAHTSGFERRSPRWCPLIPIIDPVLNPVARPEETVQGPQDEQEALESLPRFGWPLHSAGPIPFEQQYNGFDANGFEDRYPCHSSVPCPELACCPYTSCPETVCHNQEQVQQEPFSLFSDPAPLETRPVEPQGQLDLLPRNRIYPLYNQHGEIVPSSAPFNQVPEPPRYQERTNGIPIRLSEIVNASPTWLPRPTNGHEESHECGQWCTVCTPYQNGESSHSTNQISTTPQQPYYEQIDPNYRTMPQNLMEPPVVRPMVYRPQPIYVPYGPPRPYNPGNPYVFCPVPHRPSLFIPIGGAQPPFLPVEFRPQPPRRRPASRNLVPNPFSFANGRLPVVLNSTGPVPTFHVPRQLECLNRNQSSSPNRVTASHTPQLRSTPVNTGQNNTREQIPSARGFAPVNNEQQPSEPFFPNEYFPPLQHGPSNVPARHEPCPYGLCYPICFHESNFERYIERILCDMNHMTDDERALFFNTLPTSNHADNRGQPDGQQ